MDYWPLLQVLSAELDAAAACRLSQMDKAMQHWIRLHARERVYAWRHACAWLILCERAKVRVLHRWAGRRGRVSVVWNHFARVGAAVNRVRCCCTEGIANGNACGVQLKLTTHSTAPLWNHLTNAHPTLYADLRVRPHPICAWMTIAAYSIPQGNRSTDLALRLACERPGLAVAPSVPARYLEETGVSALAR